MPAKTSEQNSNADLAAIAFAALAFVLLAAFFSFRGADVGQMGQLVGKLGGGPVFGNDIIQTLLGTAVGLAIYFAWYGSGAFIVQFAIPGLRVGSGWLNVALRVGVGAAFTSLVWFLLGLAGLYTPVVGALVVVGCGILSMPANMKRVRDKDPDGFRSDKTAWTLAERSVLALIAVPLILAFIAALAPPTAKDTLLYHFAVPKAFISQHSSTFVEGNIASYLPLGAEMQALWALLFGSYFGTRAAEVAAGITTFMFLPPLLMGVYGWASELRVSRLWSLIAVAVIATVPTIYHVSSNGYIDVALGLFVTLAVYCLCRWWQGGERGLLFLMAIFLGAALSIKLTAVFIFAAFALVILLRARSDGPAAGKVVVSGFAALLLAGVLASPWYLRTWQATGSPVFPFYMSIWKGQATGWDVERSNLFQGMNAQYGGENKTAVDYLIAPWNVSVTAQPEIAEYFDGVIGVAFLFGLPLLIWGLWKFDLPVDTKIGAGIAGIMFLFWLFSSQQIRYLIPVLPALAVSIVAAANVISAKRDTLRRVLQVSFAAAAAAGILVSAAWFCQKAPVRVALGGETRNQYLARNLDYYPYYSWLNAEDAGGRQGLADQYAAGHL